MRRSVGLSILLLISFYCLLVFFGFNVLFSSSFPYLRVFFLVSSSIVIFLFFSISHSLAFFSLNDNDGKNDREDKAKKVIEVKIKKKLIMQASTMIIMITVIVAMLIALLTTLIMLIVMIAITIRLII